MLKWIDRLLFGVTPDAIQLALTWREVVRQKVLRAQEEMKLSKCILRYGIRTREFSGTRADN